MTTEMTETRTRPESWNQQRSQLASLVSGRIKSVQEQYCPKQTPVSKAILAQLRRAAGDDGTWRGLSADAFTVDRHTHVPDTMYPLTRGGEERRFGDAPTQAEIAVRSAMTLYAIHQQSRRDPMHGDTNPGAALARLIWIGNVSQDAVRRRFAALVTADSYPELSHHLRTLTRMLRDHGIPMNYGRLTADLFTWQSRNGRGGVRLRWSRDFENNTTPPKTTKNTEGEDNS